MRLSEIWSLFSKKELPAKIFTNAKFEYYVSYETHDYKIIIKYFKVANQQSIEITKDNIPQPIFSAMLQNDEWQEQA